MSARSRVLIVEDEPGVRLVFRTALEPCGLDVATVEDGAAALALLEQAPADLVLLDLRMPNLDGMGMLRLLRKQGNNVPVVIVSAHGRVPDAVEAMRLGVIDFLEKPMTPESLRRVVEDVLRRHRQPDHAGRMSAEAAGEACWFDALLSDSRRALNDLRFDEAAELLNRADGARSGSIEVRTLLDTLRALRVREEGPYHILRDWV